MMTLLEQHRENVFQRLKDFHVYCYDYTENGGNLDNELDAVKTCLDSMYEYIKALEDHIKSLEDKLDKTNRCGVLEVKS